MQPLHLKVLREIARRGSISAAAEALGYTQPAVSRHVMLLERVAGQRLVERSPRGAVLTEAGDALLVHALAILEHLDAATADMERLRHRPRAPRIAA